MAASEGDSKAFTDAVARHQAAAHAVQTGVLWDHQTGSDDGSPKHLRTGIAMAFADHQGLASLLIAKGVFTREEYAEAIAATAEEEQARYERRLSEKMGKNVKLG